MKTEHKRILLKKILKGVKWTMDMKLCLGTIMGIFEHGIFRKSKFINEIDSWDNDLVNHFYRHLFRSIPPREEKKAIEYLKKCGGDGK